MNKLDPLHDKFIDDLRDFLSQRLSDKGCGFCLKMSMSMLLETIELCWQNSSPHFETKNVDKFIELMNQAFNEVIRIWKNTDDFKNKTFK